ncbi:MAG: TIR domain-containing protein [Rhodospirillales bacterium]|nr:TIR domain-containing protein [Acetobacter sp.]
MAYRNGTYIAFHAEGKTDPTASDIKYYRILKMWHENDDIDFKFVNSHDKAAAVRDSSLKATLRSSLLERLRNSKNFVLIIGEKTRYDTDWVPFEVTQAIDSYSLPIIAVYTGVTGRITNPSNYSYLWPEAFAARVRNNKARAIHIPFRQGLIDKAIRQYHLNNMPGWPNTIYNDQTYSSFGL